MSFNQRPVHQDLSEQTSNSQTPGNGTLTSGHDSDYQDSSIQNWGTQIPTTKQPPTLPGIAATRGVPSHPDSLNFSLHQPSTGSNIHASRNWTQAHVNRGRWSPRNNNNATAPLNRAQQPSNPFGHNPNHPWNNNSARAPPNPHPVVASAAAHSAAAGYLPSTFTPGPISARNQKLMYDSTPLEPSDQQSRMPNPLGSVGTSRYAARRAHYQLLIDRLRDSAARRQVRLSTAQTEGTDMSHRPSTNSTGTIVATEQTSYLEILATPTEAAPNGTLPQSSAPARADPSMHEGSDSSPGIETPDSEDEAEYYGSSIHGDAE